MDRTGNGTDRRSDLATRLPPEPVWLDGEVADAMAALEAAIDATAVVLTAGTAALATDAPAPVPPRGPEDGDPTVRDYTTSTAVVRAVADAVPTVRPLLAAADEADSGAVASELRSFSTDGDRRRAIATLRDGIEDVRDRDDPRAALDRLREVVDAGSDEAALARFLALHALCCSRDVRDRVGEWSASESDAAGGIADVRRSFDLTRRHLEDAVAPEALDREGFVRLTPLYFADGPGRDPTTYWHTGFTLTAVRAGLAYRRESVEAELVETLAGEDSRVLVGGPGTGKSTLCRGVAVEWYESGRGTVLYGERATGGDDGRLEGLGRAIERGDGHVLVVVERLPAAPGDALADLIERYRDDPVSFLFEADDDAVDAAGEADRFERDGDGDAGHVLAAGVPTFEVPPVDEGTVASVVDAFERTTGNTVTTDPETLFDRVRSGREGAGDIVRIAYRLVTEAGESTAGIDRDVARAYDRVRDLAGTAEAPIERVALLANVLAVAGLPVDRAYLDTLDADPDAVDAAVDRLDGSVLFVVEGSIEPNHESWAALYLRRLVEETDPEAAHERFATVVNALFDVFDREVRERIAAARGRSDFVAPVSPPASLVERLLEPGLRWPVLAPLYGTAEDSQLALSAVCSTGTLAKAVADRGDMYFARGDTETALAEYERARELVEADDRLPPQLRDRNRAAYFANRGKVARRRGEFSAAADYYERSLSLSRDIDDRQGTAGALTLLGNLRLRQGSFEAAIDRFEAALSIYRNLGDHPEIARTLNDLGAAAWEQGDVDAAEEYLRESLSYNRRLRDRGAAAECLHMLAMVDWQRSEFDDAREKYERSLGIRRQIGDRPGQAATLNGLGNVGLDLGEYDRAQDCFEEALEIFREVGDEHAETAVVTGLGNLAMDRDDYETARDRFAEARDLFERIGDESRLAEAQNNLGMAALRLGDLEAARRHFEASLETRRSVDDPHGAANAMNNLGTVARRQGDLDTARNRHEEALQHHRAKDNTRGIGESLIDLGRVEREAGDRESALTYLENGVEHLLDCGTADVVDPLQETIDLRREVGDRERAAEWCNRATDELDGDAADRFERRRERLRE